MRQLGAKGFFAIVAEYPCKPVRARSYQLAFNAMGLRFAPFALSLSKCRRAASTSLS